MTIYFLELPGWHFDACEVSAGVYRITGTCGGEERVEKTGTDTADLLEQCQQEAMRLTNAPGTGDRR